MAEQAEAVGVMLVDRGHQGLELEGDAGSLCSVADALAKADAIQIRTEHGPAAIQVARSGDLLLMRHSGSEVIITSKQDCLDELAGVVRLVAAGPARPSTIRTTHTSSGTRAIHGSIPRASRSSSRSANDYCFVLAPAGSSPPCPGNRTAVGAAEAREGPHDRSQLVLTAVGSDG